MISYFHEFVLQHDNKLLPYLLIQDILDDMGFLRWIWACLNIRKGGLAILGVLCSTWSIVNRTLSIYSMHVKLRNNSIDVSKLQDILRGERRTILSATSSMAAIKEIPDRLQDVPRTCYIQTSDCICRFTPMRLEKNDSNNWN